MEQPLVTRQKLQEFGQDYVRILTREILKAGKVATGRLINSLNYKLKDDGRNIAIILESEEYLKFVDAGRKSGTYPPIKPLLQWVSVKGIPKSAAYAIQKSIYKFGIPPTNVLPKTISAFDTDPQLKLKWEKAVVDQIIKKIEEDNPDNQANTED